MELDTFVKKLGIFALEFVTFVQKFVMARMKIEVNTKQNVYSTFSTILTKYNCLIRQ